jgi:hypothetical protein
MPLLERQHEDEIVREVKFDTYSKANLKLTKKLDVLESAYVPPLMFYKRSWRDGFQAIR